MWLHPPTDHSHVCLSALWICFVMAVTTCGFATIETPHRILIIVISCDWEINRFSVCSVWICFGLIATRRTGSSSVPVITQLQELALSFRNILYNTVFCVVLSLNLVISSPSSSAPSCLVILSSVLSYPQLHSFTNHPPQYLVSRFVLSICQILTITLMSTQSVQVLVLHFYSGLFVLRFLLYQFLFCQLFCFWCSGSAAFCYTRDTNNRNLILSFHILGSDLVCAVC